MQANCKNEGNYATNHIKKSSGGGADDCGTGGVKEFRLNFGEDDEVNEVIASLEVLPSGQAQAENDDSWYTLDGRKLQAKPTQRGIYIHNGKKILK